MISKKGKTKILLLVVLAGIIFGAAGIFFALNVFLRVVPMWPLAGVEVVTGNTRQSAVMILLGCVGILVMCGVIVHSLVQRIRG